MPDAASKMWFKKAIAVGPNDYACTINLYKAMLGASLAIVKEHQPLSSMKDVLKSDYSIVTLGGTTQETYFTKADKASYLHKISEKKLISTQINFKTSLVPYVSLY